MESVIEFIVDYWYKITDIHNWIMDIHKWYIYNWFMDIHK